MSRRAIWIGAAVLGAIAIVALGLSRRGGDEESSQDRGPATVVLARAGGDELTRTLEAVANVEAAESVVVTAEAAGRVAAVLFTDGQRVTRGQPLFRMESDQEAADLAAARAEAEELRARLGRLERLVDEGAVPRGEVEDARRQTQAADARAASLRTLLNDTVVRAPFDGVVGLREVSPGALVQPGDELVSLDDARSIKLRFTLPEAQVARVQVGAPIQATSPALPGRLFQGEITGFDSRLGSGQRTLEVQARLPNADGVWRAGMLADVSITAEVLPTAVTVPPMAVQVRGDVQFVYRAVEGCAQRVEVEIGQRERERLEIVRGLSAGDAVVVEGFQDLATGDPIRAAPPQGQQSQHGSVQSSEGGAGKDDEAKGGQQEKSGAEKRREEEANQQAEERCQALMQRLDQERQAQQVQQPSSDQGSSSAAQAPNVRPQPSAAAARPAAPPA